MPGLALRIFAGHFPPFTLKDRAQAKISLVALRAIKPWKGQGKATPLLGHEMSLLSNNQPGRERS